MIVSLDISDLSIRFFLTIFIGSDGGD